VCVYKVLLVSMHVWLNKVLKSLTSFQVFCLQNFVYDYFDVHNVRFYLGLMRGTLRAIPRQNFKNIQKN
jgi:hypothetical protein